MELGDVLPSAVHFEWDPWNISKNWDKHHVKPSECEDVFFNDPKIEMDHQHSQKEPRYFAYGASDAERLLFVVFTIRGNQIRVISARNMSRKERRMYYEKTKENP